MDSLHKHILHIFCCIPHRRKIDKEEKGFVTTLQQPASILSIPLPHSTVPHSSSESHTEDARALHHIFSSSSSIRGYQTAATTPGYQPTSRPSFDRDFHFGTRPESPQKQPQSRIEKLGDHIRQKLSESRLSKTSSQHDVSHTDVGLRTIKSPPAAKGDPTLGVSQSLTGLTELLASRNASQGGYDSDARTIQTPLVRSNASTLEGGAGFARHALDKIEQSGNHDRTSQSLRAPKDNPWHVNTPTSYEKAKSSLATTTPSRASFATALQMSTNESPSVVLKRLSVSIANGTIKMPSTPELRALQTPSANEIEHDWRLGLPYQSPSLKANEEGMHKSIKRLSDKVESLKRQSKISADGDDNRASLISELDPALIDCMSKYAERTSFDESLAAEPDHEEVTVIHVEEGRKESPSLSVADKSKHPGTAGIQSSTEVDNDSVHLFDMRISHQLSSFSKVPVLSPASSQNASSHSVVMKGADSSLRPSTSNTPRYPQFIASQHNRRPSDPQTRWLFEGPDTHRRMPKSTWLTVTSMPSSGDSTMRPRPTKDDASSLYSDDNGLRSAAVSPTSSRRNSLMNPNSIAVGGRSVSARLPDRQSNQSAGQLSVAAESDWLGQRSPQQTRLSEDSWMVSDQVVTRGRSVSMPQKRAMSPEQSPTPFSKKHREPTTAAKGISEISLERVMDRRNECITEITQHALEERRNENFAEFEHSFLHVPRSNDRRYQSNDQFVSINSSPNRPLPGRSISAVTGKGDEPPQEIPESATSVWERAFKHARDDDKGSAFGNFLTVPQYDREGRRRSTQTTTSAASSARRPSLQSIHSLEQRRSQSAEPSRRSSIAIDLDLHQHLCSAARMPLPGAPAKLVITDSIITKPKSQNLKEQSRPRKKSLLDIGRRSTTAAASAESDRTNGASTPIRDLLSTWARFPSHNREERNGTATLNDGIRSYDFQPEGSRKVISPDTANPVRAFTTPITFKSLSHKVHKKLDKTRSKSMTLTSRSALMLTPGERAKRRRKGIMGKWRKMYRSSSGELRRYAMAHGHRSSISLGAALEYPELECLPGEGLFHETDVQRWRSEVDGSADLPPDQQQSTSTTKAGMGSNRSEPEAAVASKPEEVGASDWANYYASCVGSLSALKSDDGIADVRSMSLNEHFGMLRKNLAKFEEERDWNVAVIGPDVGSVSRQSSSRASGKGKEIEGTIDGRTALHSSRT